MQLNEMIKNKPKVGIINTKESMPLNYNFSLGQTINKKGQIGDMWGNLLFKLEMGVSPTRDPMYANIYLRSIFLNGKVVPVDGYANISSEELEQIKPELNKVTIDKVMSDKLIDFIHNKILAMKDIKLVEELKKPFKDDELFGD